MHVVQILLPLRDNQGEPFARELFERVRSELAQRFGGVTAYLRAPAEGHWRDRDGAFERDEVVIVEVMCDELDRPWWSSYREQLAQTFGQQELVARALAAEAL